MPEEMCEGNDEVVKLHNVCFGFRKQFYKIQGL